METAGTTSGLNHAFSLTCFPSLILRNVRSTAGNDENLLSLQSSLPFPVRGVLPSGWLCSHSCSRALAGEGSIALLLRPQRRPTSAASGAAPASARPRPPQARGGTAAVQTPKGSWASPVPVPSRILDVTAVFAITENFLKFWDVSSLLRAVYGILT